ncbi:unnamed protein product [Linum trigynum]|uniref:Reverse transcriptase zinc-binding domain-containing protein n=1 Tax=Linum trigynum TaxID=586398 RepID=A0AAV2GUX3_9ROSI
MMVYSTRRVWETLRHKAPKVPWYSLVWGKNCPPRCSLIVWLIVKKAIVTRDRLLRWGKINDASCQLCNSSIESREHLFVHCPYWKSLAEELKCAMLLRPDWTQMLRMMAQVGTSRTRMWHGLMWCLMVTYTWKERCGVIHGAQRRTPAQVADQIRDDIQFIAYGNKSYIDILVELGYI